MAMMCKECEKWKEAYTKLEKIYHEKVAKVAEMAGELNVAQTLHTVAVNDREKMAAELVRLKQKSLQTDAPVQGETKELVMRVAKEISDALYKQRGMLGMYLEQQMTAWIFALEAAVSQIEELLKEHTEGALIYYESEDDVRELIHSSKTNVLREVLSITGRSICCEEDA